MRFLRFLFLIVILIFTSCSAENISMGDTDQTIFILSDRTNKMELHTFQLNSGKFEYIDFTDLSEETVIESYAWSPKINKWFFSLTTSEGNDIFSLDFDGRNLNRITEIPEVQKSTILPSPSGKHVAFIGFSNGMDIYIAHLKGNEIFHLNLPYSNESAINWTMDSNFLIFRSDLNGLPNIFSINNKAENLENISNGPGVDGLFDLSQQENKIVFESDRDGNIDLFTAEIGDTEYINITSDPARDTSPHWSPNGKYILFQSDRDGGEDLYLIDTDSYSVSRLTFTPEIGELNPVWCPDNTCVLFNANQTGNQDIYKVTVEGELKNLTKTETNEISPQWLKFE